MFTPSLVQGKILPFMYPVSVSAITPIGQRTLQAVSKNWLILLKDSFNLDMLPIIGIFKLKVLVMSKNTSISLGDYFEEFVHEQIKEGRYKNVSEVIRAALRLLENEESEVIALKNAIQEGIDSGIAHSFDPKKHIESLKANQ